MSASKIFDAPGFAHHFEVHGAHCGNIGLCAERAKCVITSGKLMIVGIDLGTTNSLIGVWRDGRTELIPNALGSFLTPSAIYIDQEGMVHVGMATRDRLSTQPGRSITAFKRYMGTTRKFTLGEQQFGAVELSALVLRSLKQDAERYLQCSIEEAIVTVPAYFNDFQRKATKAAAEMAGLRVERLLNEPAAAALA